MTLRPCLGCGNVGATSWCTECRPPERPQRSRGTARQRGYTTTWDALSRRARKLQPFCLDCGTTEGLTTDHKPEAWQRHAEGKALRLQDVDVVCGPCNAARGSSRPGSERALTWGDAPPRGVPDPAGETQRALHTAHMCHNGSESAVQALSSRPGVIG